MDRFRVSRVHLNGEETNSKKNNLTISFPLRECQDNQSQEDSQEVYTMHGGGTPGSMAEAAHRRRSLAQLTREALPRMDNYRLSKRLKRPSLGELHGDAELGNKDNTLEKEPKSGPAHHGVKLGWIQGVFIPCLLNIWGVMLFLRLSWVVAQAGISQTLVIIGISTVVCVITSLSLSAICTNGEVKGGGIYYIISRSLGPEFGASVGIVFAFANSVAASMNTIGFCNSLNDLLRESGLSIVDGGVNDVRIVGVIALVIMVVICAVGMEWESKAQNFLVAIIAGAILDFLIGTMVGPSEEEMVKGFTGFNLEVFKANWPPNYRFSEKIDQSFFSVFAIFFPSVTGIQAGANISGDLKDPASSIPKGTLLSLVLSMFSYVVFVFFAGGATMRDASGNMTDLINGTVIPSCAPGECPYGLHNSYSVMQLMSGWGPFIYAGCFAATLSTALTNLLSVPRLIQALGIDKIYPGLIFFSKGYGKAGEPYRGYVLTFFISAIFLLIAELNVIAPLISNFYLASYALINFCTFHAALIKPLGWRPTFRYYNMWLSLAGFVLCVIIMFLIDWATSLITFIIIFALYLLVVYRRPDVNWGSSTQAQTYKTALSSAYRLVHISEHVKNYRPQILVLAGSPQTRPPLIDLAYAITKNNSLLICADIQADRISYRARSKALKAGMNWLSERKIKSFYNIVDGQTFENGAKSLVQSVGIGKLSPNVLMMGYKTNWRDCDKSELTAYFDVLHNAFDLRLSVTILRLRDGLNYLELLGEGDNTASAEGLNTVSEANGFTNPVFTLSGELTVTRGPPLRMALFGASNARGILHADSNLNLAALQSEDTGSLTSHVLHKSAARAIMEASKRQKQQQQDDQIVYRTRNGSEVPKRVITSMSMFSRRQPPGTIDVWWLYDDGGLTILLPYILSTRSHWADCKLRIFALANRQQEMELEERNMANLLSKFRIDYSSLQMVQDITVQPQPETVQLFNELLDGFRESEREDDDECFVSDIEMATLHEKSNRQMRLSELLQQHSSEANLVIMSLPMPRKGTVSAPLYMAWLEILTRDMPPFLLVRGNQTSVLTFYS